MFTKIYSNYIISQSQLQQFHSLICNPFLRTYSKIVHLYTKGGTGTYHKHTHSLKKEADRAILKEVCATPTRSYNVFTVYVLSSYRQVMR